MNCLFPSKHVSFNESLIGIGAIILKHLEGGRTIDQLWAELQTRRNSRERLPEKIEFDTVILAVVFLYLVGAVELNKTGVIIYAAP